MLNSAQNPPALLLFNIHVFFKGIFHHENLKIPLQISHAQPGTKQGPKYPRPTLEESMQVVGFFHPFKARPAMSERQQKPWLDSHGSPPDAGEPRHVELRGGQIWKRHLEDSTFDGNLR